MPGTPEEVIHLARMVIADEVAVDHIEDVQWCDGTRVSDEERRNVCALAAYEIQRRREIHHQGQRRALRLLRTFLSAEQLRQLNAAGEFIVVGSAGGTYRLSARVGVVWQVERHGRRYFARRSFCFHDPEYGMPPADETIGQLFHLLTDEPGFLAEANAREFRLWDGEWMRWLNLTSRCRQTGEPIPHHPRFNPEPTPEVLIAEAENRERFLALLDRQDLAA